MNQFLVSDGSVVSGEGARDGKCGLLLSFVSFIRGLPTLSALSQYF